MLASAGTKPTKSLLQSFAATIAINIDAKHFHFLQLKFIIQLFCFAAGGG
jgi:hypothetical protein